MQICPRVGNRQVRIELISRVNIDHSRAAPNYPYTSNTTRVVETRPSIWILRECVSCRLVSLRHGDSTMSWVSSNFSKLLDHRSEIHTSLLHEPSSTVAPS